MYVHPRGDEYQGELFRAMFGGKFVQTQSLTILTTQCPIRVRQKQKLGSVMTDYVDMIGAQEPVNWYYPFRHNNERLFIKIRQEDTGLHWAWRAIRWSLPRESYNQKWVQR